MYSLKFKFRTGSGVYPKTEDKFLCNDTYNTMNDKFIYDDEHEATLSNMFPDITFSQLIISFSAEIILRRTIFIKNLMCFPGKRHCPFEEPTNTMM